MEETLMRQGEWIVVGMVLGLQGCMQGYRSCLVSDPDATMTMTLDLLMMTDAGCAKLGAIAQYQHQYR